MAHTTTAAPDDTKQNGNFSHFIHFVMIEEAEKYQINFQCIKKAFFVFLNLNCLFKQNNKLPIEQ